MSDFGWMMVAVISISWALVVMVWIVAKTILETEK
jgi:hypothetical protein